MVLKSDKSGFKISVYFFPLGISHVIWALPNVAKTQFPSQTGYDIAI